MSEKQPTAFVSLRLNAELVKRLDELAEMEGLTRTAVIERLARREFTGTRLVAPVSVLKQIVADAVKPLEGDPVCEWLLCGPPAFTSSIQTKRKGRSA